MKTILSAIILACLLCLVADCDNFAILVISKVVSLVLLVLCGRLFPRYMSEEELNERV